ncbi:MAG: DNA ligase D [Planctomycetes bacterium]|nr:DNA ligase D [Planctomycetota bacterium]
MSLQEYRRKRRFSQTPEPAGAKPPRREGHSFVVQKHAAKRLHYDFRLELDGVLKSWAIPKGPSLDPSEKRLAVQVEDHPLEYGGFEGIIPEGEYGGGTVIVWDRGEWEPLEDAAESYRQGKLKFRLYGKKLHGGWTLVKIRSRPGERGENWLLIKERDDEARPLGEYDILEAEPESAVSGRGLGQVAAAKDRTWHSNQPDGKPAAPPPKPAKPAKKAAKKKQAATTPLTGSHPGTLPEWLPPQLASPSDKAPVGTHWLHEIKFDGYRLLCRIHRGKAKLLTRNKQDWTHRFPQLAAAAATLPVKDALLDGEVVAYDESGISHFQTLQNAFRDGGAARLVYQAFDLLHLDGHDLRKVPLIERKARLEELLEGNDSRSILQYTEHFAGNGPEFFNQACRMGLEGTISKRGDRPYIGGRGYDWLKIKCVEREEFVIGGFTDPSGSRHGLGALLVGYFDHGGELKYAGKVGTGFSEQALFELRRRLDALEQDGSPFTNLSRRDAGRGTHWVQPELVAQVEFSNWTGDGLLRHPSFQGLREDKPANEVVRDAPPTVAKGRAPMTRQKPAKIVTGVIKGPDEVVIEGVRVTHPQKVLYAGQGITKLGLVEFYAEIADWILPHVLDRPLSLVRCPNGHKGECFFQKHADAGTPSALGRVAITEKDKTSEYLVIENLAGLISLVQMGVLEIHPWGSRRDNVERPDRLIFDLDPDPSVAWPRVIEGAKHVRDTLADLGLTSFVKTTGGRGLHVVVPIQRRLEWPEVKEFCKAVVEQVARAAPAQYTANMSKAARKGRVYLDYLRNDRGATAVAAYSTRARSGAAVSVPLEWDELSPALRPDHFNVLNLPARLAALKHDPWREISKLRQSITVKARRQVGL